jgi:hypothetical protein
MSWANSSFAVGSRSSGTILALAGCSTNDRSTEGDDMDKEPKFADPKGKRAPAPSAAPDVTPLNDDAPRTAQPGAFVDELAISAPGELLVERIRERAYLIWIESGRVDGNHREHWRAAEEAIRAEFGPDDAPSDRR